MADEREGQDRRADSPSNSGGLQSEGRRANAAQPLDAAEDRGGPERYPETRSFAQHDAPAEGEAEADPQSPPDRGRLGLEVDPAEGKR